MLMIRLQRVGKKKQPSYRFIVSDKLHDTQSKNVEVLGIYNPMVKPKVIELKKERVEYWLKVGAQMSSTVNNLFITQGIIKDGKKKKSVF
jgi:small subunit ribosomal protein S16